MTFQGIKQDAFGRLSFQSSPASEVDTRIGRYVNRWHRKILSMPVFRSFRRVQVTQASVAATFEYGISLAEIFYITERTNNTRLQKRTEDWWRRHYPDPTEDTGTPASWVPLGYMRTQRRPSDASELFVISTSASDTGTAYVEAIRSNGYPRSLSVTMTGTTGVSIGTAITDIVDVVDFYVSAAAVGTITLREDSGTGTVLSTIPIGASYPRFLRYVLAPTPSSAITYYLDGLADIVDMSNTLDQPFIPLDFHDLLVDGAVHDEWVAKGRRLEARELRADIERRIQDLRAWVWMHHVQPDRDTEEPRAAEEEFTLPIT